MRKFKLIGIGEILWDEFANVKKLGGAPANFAFHVNQLGGDGMIISRVGNDINGEEISSLLAKKKLLQLMQVDEHYPTGRVSVHTTDQGIPHYAIHRNAAWDFIEFNDTLKKKAKQADAICFGTLAQRNKVSRDTIQRFIRATSKKCLKICDINLRQDNHTPELIYDLLKICDVLKLNKEELDIIAGLFLSHSDETSRLNELKSRFNLNTIVLTKGEEGSRLYRNTQEEATCSPPPRSRIIDTVGAGDSFTAAVALGLLNGKSLETVNKTATAVATFVCSQKGATPALPYHITKQFLKE